MDVVNGPSSPPRTLDLSAFDGRVDRRAAREFFAADAGAAIPEGESPLQRHRRQRVYGALGALALLLGVGLYVFVPMEDDRLPFTLTGGGLLTLALTALEAWRGNAVRAYQVARFADANGFVFCRLQDTAGYEGMMFRNGWGHHRWMTVNTRVGGRPVEFGNLSFSEGSARTVSRRRGYIALRLPARLPPMLVTTRSHPLFTATIPQYPHRHERVDVGQGRAFRVFVPQGAERIARTLFTPEVVALCARLARRYTIEITGDMLFLYRFRDVSVARARLWQRQFADVGALAEAVTSSSVWSAMDAQPRRFLRDLPEMRRHVMVRRPWSTAWILVAAIVAFALAFTFLIVVLPDLL